MTSPLPLLLRSTWPNIAPPKTPVSHLWRPPVGVTGTVSVVSLGSWGVRALDSSAPPTSSAVPPPALSWSESTSSTLTAGRRLIELSDEEDKNKLICYPSMIIWHLGNENNACSTCAEQGGAVRSRAGDKQIYQDLYKANARGSTSELGHE